MRKAKFFGSVGFAELITDIAPFRCLDIGARGGLTRDLAPIAWAVDLYGFEPDKTECDQLNALYSRRGSSPFRSVVLFPVALGRAEKRRPFYLTTWQDSSSFLQPLPEIGKEFSRSEYVTVQEIRELETVPLDDFLVANGVTDVVFLKANVEGLELEILQSAKKLLSSSLLAIRLEVSFLTYRIGAPRYGELETFLMDRGFIPMEFLELRHWRRLAKPGYPSKSSGIIPFSKGQIALGHVLFFRDPDSLERETPKQIDLLLKAAILAITYGYIDHAYRILERPSIKQYLQTKYDVDIGRELRAMSLNMAWQHRRERIHHFCSLLRARVGLRTRVRSWLHKDLE